MHAYTNKAFYKYSEVFKSILKNSYMCEEQ